MRNYNIVKRDTTEWTLLTIYIVDECEGCQVHNLLCEAGTGKMHGFSTAGHFAEYSVSDYRNAMVLPEDADMVSSAPLFCAGVTGIDNILSSLIQL